MLTVEHVTSAPTTTRPQDSYAVLADDAQVVATAHQIGGGMWSVVFAGSVLCLAQDRATAVRTLHLIAQNAEGK